MDRPGVDPSSTASCALGESLSFSVPQFLLLYDGTGNDGDGGDNCTCTS